MAKKTGLGKGLDALFIDNTTSDSQVSEIKISQIEPNTSQPRRDFDQQALRELADSIREHGVIQPLVVRPLEKGGYQIVAGERRWRAARMAGMTQVPVVVRDLDDLQTLEIAIIENLQREDLNVVELALGYRVLMEEHGMTQEQVAEKVGKSRPVVANTVRLLQLPESVLVYLREGKLSAGHAKALLSLEDLEEIEGTAKKAAQGGVLVRDIENMAKQKRKVEKGGKERNRKNSSSQSSWADSFHKEMEIALSAELGRRVTISSQGKKATITLEFYNDQELADIASRLSKSN